MAVGTAMTSPLAQSNTFEFIEYVMTQYLKRTIAKQWAVYVCITRAINVCVLKELFRVDPPILELLPTLTCRQVKHLSDHGGEALKLLVLLYLCLENCASLKNNCDFVGHKTSFVGSDNVVGRSQSPIMQRKVINRALKTMHRKSVRKKKCVE